MTPLLSVSLVVLSLVAFTVAGTSYNYVQDEKEDKVDFNRPFDASYYLEKSCPKQFPIDRKIVRRAEECLEKALNNDVVAELLLMASTRDFQKFSTKVCNRWPHIKLCLDEIISYLEGCHEKSYIGQVTDEVATYVCTTPAGDDGGNETTNLGDFLTADGMSCTNFDELAFCMKYSLDESISFCTMVEQIRKCSKTAFDGCTNSKPWEVIVKGLGELEAVMRCGTPEENGIASSAPSLNSINI